MRSFYDVTNNSHFDYPLKTTLNKFKLILLTGNK